MCVEQDIGGMASQSSVQRPMNKKEILLKHARSLLHAQTCSSKEKCTSTSVNCDEAKCRFNHVISCQKETGCTFRHCSTYKKILAHQRDCYLQDCCLCQELRGNVTRDTDTSLMKMSRRKETKASCTNPRSEFPLSDKSSIADDTVLLQMEMMYKAAKNIQMSNRKILAQLNYNEREDNENARFRQVCKQSLHNLFDHMKKKDNYLSKLKNNVSELQEKMDQIKSLIRAKYVQKGDEVHNNTHDLSSRDRYGTLSIDGHISWDDRGWHEDDSNDNDGQEGNNVLPNLSSPRKQYSNTYELDTKQVSAQQRGYDESSAHLDQQLEDEILSSDADSDISLGGLIEEKETESNMLACKRKENLHLSSSSPNDQDSRDTEGKEGPGANNNANVNPSPRNNIRSSDRTSTFPGTDNIRKIRSEPDTVLQYKLPPPQSTRSQGHTEKDKLLMRDSRGFKRKCTSVTVDNRYNELEKMCSNIPVVRKGKRSGHHISPGPFKQNICKEEAPLKTVKPRAPLASQDKDRQNSYTDSVPDADGQNIDFSTWIDLANAEVNKAKIQRLHVGKGPDTILCLDISKSMMGENFRIMISLAKTFIQEIATIASRHGLEENIAITVFGHETRVICHLTDEYQRLLSELDELTAGGNTPLAGGLLMALAGCLGNRRVTTILEARILLLTSGRATENGTFQSLLESSLMGDLRIKGELNGVCQDLKDRGHRVFWIPIGKDTTSIFTDFITSTTKGKTIDANKSSEMGRLVQWSQLWCIAMDLSFHYKDQGQLDRSTLGIYCESLGVTCNIDDLLDIIAECPGSVQHVDYYHAECDSSMPKLGTRVKRGPTWRWGNQDTGGFGTVVGHRTDGSLRVEWDNGTNETYEYNRNAKDVEVTDAPRVLQGHELIATGCKVKRGVSWQGGDEDGGAGSVGSVFADCGNGIVGVRWQKGKQGMYRFGYDGHFDIQICQPDELEETKQPTKKRLTSEIPKSMNIQREEQVNTTPSVEEMNRRNVRKNTECKAKWQYMKDEGTWTNYSVEQNDKLEKAYQRNKEGSPIAEVEGEMSTDVQKPRKQETTIRTKVTRDDLMLLYEQKALTKEELILFSRQEPQSKRSTLQLKSMDDSE